MTPLEGASPPLIAGSLITCRHPSQGEGDPTPLSHTASQPFSIYFSLIAFYNLLQGPVAVPRLGTVTGAACRVHFQPSPPTRESSDQLEGVSKPEAGQTSSTLQGTITQPLRGPALRHCTVNLCLITRLSVATSPASRGEPLGGDGGGRIYRARNKRNRLQRDGRTFVSLQSPHLFSGSHSSSSMRSRLVANQGGCIISSSKLYEKGICC